MCPQKSFLLKTVAGFVKREHLSTVTLSLGRTGKLQPSYRASKLTNFRKTLNSSTTSRDKLLKVTKEKDFGGNSQMRLLNISHKYRYLLSRDPGSTPAEESQRALSKFNLAGKGASHYSF